MKDGYHHMLSMKHFEAHVTPEMTKLINATVSAIENSIPDNEDSRESHEHAVALLSEALGALLNGNSVTILNSDAKLAITEAADVALVSPGTLWKMIRANEVPLLETEHGHRILMGDALAVRNKVLEEKKDNLLKLWDFEEQNNLNEILSL